MSRQNNKKTQKSLSAPFDKYIDKKLREEITGISRASWWRLERQDKTPPVYRISTIKRWLLSEVLDWNRANEGR